MLFDSISFAVFFSTVFFCTGLFFTIADYRLQGIWVLDKLDGEKMLSKNRLINLYNAKTYYPVITRFYLGKLRKQ